MIRFAILVAAPFILHAQQNPLSVGAKADYTSVRDYFTRSAGMMPDADYSSGPTPQVRTFAQVIAHVADDQYNLCAPVRGEVRKAAYTEIENTLSAKADLVPAPRNLRIVTPPTTRSPMRMRPLPCGSAKAAAPSSPCFTGTPGRRGNTTATRCVPAAERHGPTIEHAKPVGSSDRGLAVKTRGAG